MAVIIPPQYANVSMWFSREGDAEEMAITFGVNGTNATDLEAIPEGVAVAWLDAYPATDLNAGMTFRRVTARIGQDGGEPLSVEHQVNSAGTNTGLMLPQNTAMLVRKNTSRGGRRGRGRLYLPWTFESDVDNVGRINDTSAAGIQSNLTAFLTNLSTGAPSLPSGPIPMVLLHEALGGTAPGSPDVVTSLALQQIVATQRRRLRR